MAGYIPRWFAYLKAVTWAQCGVALFLHPTLLPLCQTATVRRCLSVFYIGCCKGQTEPPVDTDDDDDDDEDEEEGDDYDEYEDYADGSTASPGTQQRDDSQEPRPAPNVLSAGKNSNNSSRAKRAATHKPKPSTTVLVRVSCFLFISAPYR